MVKVYYNRVVSEQITFAEVPSELQPQVKAYALLKVEEGSLSNEDYIKYFGVE